MEVVLESCDQSIAKISLQANSCCRVGWGGVGGGGGEALEEGFI